MQLDSAGGLPAASRIAWSVPPPQLTHGTCMNTMGPMLVVCHAVLCLYPVWRFSADRLIYGFTVLGRVAGREVWDPGVLW